MSSIPRYLAQAALCAIALGCAGSDPTGSSGSSNDDSGPVWCSLDERYLSLSAAAKDGIPAIDDPIWVSADAPELDFLSDSDRVVGFTVGGQAYAVPLNLLWYHEIVNATFVTPAGALDLAVTHCPLTGTSMVFDRGVAAGAEFGVSGILYQSNLVMYDRNSGESFWPQMYGEARCGPAQGTELPMYESIEIRWDGWASLHPDTEVLSRPNGAGSGYDTNPYAGYDAPNAEYTFPMPPLDTRLPPKTRVLGVVGQNGSTWAFPLGELESRGAYGALSRSFGAGAAEAVVLWDRARGAAAAYHREVGGTVLSLRADSAGIYDGETGSRWSVDGIALEGPLAGAHLEAVEPSYVAYWGAWAAFFPLGRIWGQQGPGY